MWSLVKVPGQARCTPAGEQVAELNDVVLGFRQPFQHCYEDVLARDAAIQGSVHMAVRIKSDGGVASVRGLAIGIPPEATDCMTRVVAGARFKPIRGGAMFRLPMNYVAAPAP